MNDTPIQIVGNLTAEPELRQTTSGKPVVNLRVATNPRRFDRQANEWADGETNYFDIEVWYDQAANVVRSLTKGDRVILFGNVRTKTWKLDDSGARRSKLIVVAAEIGSSLRYATAEPVKEDSADTGPETEEPPF